VGLGYNVHRYDGRVALPRRCARPSLTPRCWLVDEPKSRGHDRSRFVTHGVVAATTGKRRIASFRSRQPIRGQVIPTVTERSRYEMQHESKR
jgi:hypothetical protein